MSGGTNVGGVVSVPVFGGTIFLAHGAGVEDVVSLCGSRFLLPGRLLVIVSSCQGLNAGDVVSAPALGGTFLVALEADVDDVVFLKGLVLVSSIQGAVVVVPMSLLITSGAVVSSSFHFLFWFPPSFSL